MLNNTKETYGLIAQLLHWATALLIFILIPLGVFMHELPINTSEEIVYKSWFYSLHKTLGVTVFGIAILRVIWAFIQPKPGALNADRKLESFLASTIHWTLYGSIIAMPLTGWLHHSALEGFAPIWWPFSQDLPFIPKNADLASAFGTAHFLTGILLVLSLVLHVVGALKHTFVDRDITLKRMVPGAKVAVTSSMVRKLNSRFPLTVAATCFLVIGIVSGGGLLSHDHDHSHSHDTSNVTQDADGEATNLSSNSPSTEITRWEVDHAKSTLTISITQNGKPVPGEFAKWQADIAFDPEKLEASHIKASVNIASLTLGGVTEKALDQPFLNVKKFKTATFEANEIVRVGDGLYEAKGTLTLIGIAKPFVLPFALEIKGNIAIATADASIRRLDFGIGKDGFQTDGTVGFDVSISVKLEADKTD